MMKTTRTKVSKASTGIKTLLGLTVGPDWKGRKVTVCEASDSWELTHYTGSRDLLYVVHLDDGTASGPIYTPSPSQGNRYYKAQPGVALVVHQREVNTVEIVIPAGGDYHGAIDRAAFDVLVDALLQGKVKAGTRRALAAATSPLAGMVGIAAALAEARAEELAEQQTLSQEAA